MIPSISFVKLNNMKMRLFLPLSAFAALSVCLMLSSCAGGGRAVTDDPAAESRRFPLVEVPGVIVDREEAAEYLGLHYWDSFTDTAEVHACDSMRVNGVTRSEVEQKFADYIMKYPERLAYHDQDVLNFVFKDVKIELPLLLVK